MTEIPSPYGPRKKTGVERIAAFLNGFLGPEILEDIPCPENLQCDYEDLDEEGKKEWFEFTFGAIFRETTSEVTGLLGRNLTVVELNLIKRRIVNFLKATLTELEL